MLTLHDTQDFITLKVPEGMEIQYDDARMPMIYVETMDSDGVHVEWMLSGLLAESKAETLSSPGATPDTDSPPVTPESPEMPVRDLQSHENASRKRKQPA